MIDIKTGKEIKNPAVLKAPLAGSANASVGGMMRNIGARNAVMFGGHTTYDVTDYVGWGTGDLIAMWDGIRNVGATLNHDDSASIWKDLVADKHLTISSGSYFVENGLKRDTFSYEGLARYPKTIRSVNSIESCADIHGMQGTSGFCVWNGNIQSLSSTSLKIGTLAQFDVKRYNMNLTVPSKHSFHASHNAILMDNIPLENRGDTDTWNYQDGFCVFARGTVNYQLFGVCHCIRLYSRDLTPAEIEKNYLIDKARFFL